MSGREGHGRPRDAPPPHTHGTGDPAAEQPTGLDRASAEEGLTGPGSGAVRPGPGIPDGRGLRQRRRNVLPAA